MEEFRMLAVNVNNEVFEVSGEKPGLDWTWVGMPHDKLALYNKLLEGGWDVTAQHDGDHLMLRRVKQQ
jgi:hypothetical protein